MKQKILTEREITVTHVGLGLPVRYEEEQIPNNFPLRNGQMWAAKVEIDTGKIIGWPVGRAGLLYLKVVDTGAYTLYNGDDIIASRYDYVPHGVVPGEYGDYVELHINEQGIITNWPKNPDISEFFPARD